MLLLCPGQAQSWEKKNRYSGSIKLFLLLLDRIEAQNAALAFVWAKPGLKASSLCLIGVYMQKGSA